MCVVLGLNNVCIGLRRSKRYLSTAAKLVPCSVNSSNSGPSQCGSGLYVWSLQRGLLASRSAIDLLAPFDENKRPFQQTKEIFNVRAQTLVQQYAITGYISTLNPLNTTLFVVYPFHQLSQLLWTKSLYKQQDFQTCGLKSNKYELFSPTTYRIKPEELYILSCEQGRGRRVLTDLKLIQT